MIAPRYLADVLALCAFVRPGESRLVEVRHDAWCPLLTQTGPCCCDPHVQLGPLLTEDRGGPAC
jgi:hypothetical protein